MKKFILLLLAVPAVLFGCSKDESNDNELLVGTSWRCEVTYPWEINSVIRETIVYKFDANSRVTRTFIGTTLVGDPPVPSGDSENQVNTGTYVLNNNILSIHFKLEDGTEYRYSYIYDGDKFSVQNEKGLYEFRKM